MHIEILVEDTSGKRLLDYLLPRILCRLGEPHTWRLHLGILDSADFATAPPGDPERLEREIAANRDTWVC